MFFWFLSFASFPCCFLFLFSCGLVVRSSRVRHVRGDWHASPLNTPLDRSIASSCGQPIRRKAPIPDRSDERWSDQLVKLCVDAHRVLVVSPLVLVARLVLNVVVCITSCSVVPLMLACRHCHDRLCTFHARVSCRTRTQHVTTRTQLEKNAVRFDDGWTRLPGQSCHDGLDAVDAFSSLNPVTHP